MLSLPYMNTAQGHEPHPHHGSFMPVHNGIWRLVFINVLTLLVGASLGFGTSQMYVVSDVRESKLQITNLKEADAQIRKDLFDERARTDGRIADLVRLMEKSTGLNQELVNLVKVQLELAARERK